MILHFSSFDFYSRLISAFDCCVIPNIHRHRWPWRLNARWSLTPPYL